MAKKNQFFKLDMLLLCIIAKQDCYGYEITKQIKTYSHELIDIKEGTMYPILYKLQDAHYISSYENVIERKIRVYYHIEEEGKEKLEKIIYVFLTIFLYLLKCPQSLILSALRAFCFCGKPHISRSIFLYFRYQAWLKSW